MSVAYEKAIPDGWAGGLQSLDLQCSKDGVPVALSGPCPRCHDRIEVSLVDGETGVPLAPQARLSVVVRCNCTHAHAGQPAGELGCGAYGGLRIWL